MPAGNIAVEQSALATIAGLADAIIREKTDGLLLEDRDRIMRRLARQFHQRACGPPTRKISYNCALQPDLSPFLRLATNARSPSRKASSIAGINSVMGSSLP